MPGPMSITMDGASGKDTTYPEAAFPGTGTEPEQPRIVSFMGSIVPRNLLDCWIWGEKDLKRSKQPQVTFLGQAPACNTRLTHVSRAF
nr:hypothetical protein CE91St29_21410 [Corynebacterium striatum]